MKTLYFDCSSGISGNMTLGALLEIVRDENYLLKELEKLNIDGYKIKISKEKKNEITGTYVNVILDSSDIHKHTHEHHHEHNEEEHHVHHNHHHHEHRNLSDVISIINKADATEPF